MFVETLDNENRSAAFTSFFEMTTRALVDVFGKTDREARALIDGLHRKFSEAPIREQNLLLHNDPVALASDLAEVPWAKVDGERLEAFNRQRQRSFPADLDAGSAH